MLNAQLLVAVGLSIFGTTIMTYITMATPIGPWIAPTLTLLLLGLYKITHRTIHEQMVAYQIATASIGGILATGVGFYMPTLFFADPVHFDLLISYPLHALCLITVITGIAGWFGLWSARVLYPSMVTRGVFPFPISHLIHGLIVAHAQVRRMYEMIIGFVGTIFFCFLQSGMVAVLPLTIILMRATTVGCFVVPIIPFDLWPMVWAIGFITGHMLLLPLLVGVAAQIGILGPLNTCFFVAIAPKDLSLAFCSGMVLVSTVYGVYGSVIRMVRGNSTTRVGMHSLIRAILQERSLYCEGAAVCIAVIFLFLYIGMPFFAIVHTLVFGALCMYQMAGVAAKTGLAPLGRFATFVMVPAMVLFTTDVWHLTVISLFIACAGGATVDILFSHVYVRELGGSARLLWRYQYIGLWVGAVVCGIAFLFFVTHFPLGSSVLFAHKAQTRALLFTYADFDVTVLVLGALFGALLTWFRCDPLFVLGGILMPLNLSVGLIVGGLLSLCVVSRERYEPFWSGVFAANSVWMMLKVLL